jgi:hypothetical protein
VPSRRRRVQSVQVKGRDGGGGRHLELELADRSASGRSRAAISRPIHLRFAAPAATIAPRDLITRYDNLPPAADHKSTQASRRRDGAAYLRAVSQPPASSVHSQLLSNSKDTSAEHERRQSAGSATGARHAIIPRPSRARRSHQNRSSCGLRRRKSRAACRSADQRSTTISRWRRPTRLEEAHQRQHQRALPGTVAIIKPAAAAAAGRMAASLQDHHCSPLLASLLWLLLRSFCREERQQVGARSISRELFNPTIFLLTHTQRLRMGCRWREEERLMQQVPPASRRHSNANRSSPVRGSCIGTPPAQLRPALCSDKHLPACLCQSFPSLPLLPHTPSTSNR